MQKNYKKYLIHVGRAYVMLHILNADFANLNNR